MDKDKLAVNRAALNGASGHMPHGGDVSAGHDDGLDDGLGDGVVLNARIQEAIGRSLKAHYDDLVSAPVPDKFLMLLAELEAKEQQHGT